MRLNVLIPLLLLAVLLLAESQPGMPGREIEVRTSNSLIEITGADVNQVQVDDSVATVSDTDGHVVVRSDGGPLRLQVPRRSSLDVSTSNGSIHITDVTGSLRLTTSNGSIVVRNCGASELHAHSSNGAIEIGVPRGLNANLYARTSNGRIYADVDVATHHLAANFLEGRIGTGGPPIDLQTSNGSISLLYGARQETVSSTFKPDPVK